MSCWVVPTIAAEIWGVPVDSVVQRIGDGSLAHRVDEGFVFVEVEPAAPAAPVKAEHPPTYTVLSAAEVEALEAGRAEQANTPASESPVEGDEGAESQSPDDDEASVELGDWRAARQRVARTRIPPRRSANPRAA